MAANWLVLLISIATTVGCIHRSTGEAALVNVMAECMKSGEVLEAPTLPGEAGAEETLPDAIKKFQQGLPTGSVFVVMRAPSSTKAPENVSADDTGSLIVDEIHGGQITGHQWGHGAKGTRVTFPTTEVVDWIIMGSRCISPGDRSLAETAMEKVLDNPCVDPAAMSQKEIRARVVQARASLPEATARFQRGEPVGSIFIVLHSPDYSYHPDNPWAGDPDLIVVDEVLEATIVGHEWQMERDTDRHSFPQSEVVDWYLVSAEGIVEGNWLVRCRD